MVGDKLEQECMHNDVGNEGMVVIMPVLENVFQMWPYYYVIFVLSWK